MSGKLYYGDNLEVMREHIADESIDLVYLDPPFNSRANYNVLFRSPSGEDSQAQVAAFKDTWDWTTDGAEETYWQILKGPRANANAARMLEAMRSFLGESDMMAYLVMMGARLIELHRVLKPTGSLYIHCDPTASHYLKMLLDAVFGPKQFANEIIWKRTSSHNTANQYGRVHDTIFYYRKGKKFTWNKQYVKYSDEQIGRYKPDENGRLFKAENLTAERSDSASGKFEWRGTTPGPTRGWGYALEQLEAWWSEGRILVRRDGTPRLDGLKIYFDEMPGQMLQSVWTDIERVGNTSAERLGYPTQKPVALLERIIASSSNAGDVILDPFCGCGTTVHAAQKLGRQWIGIDITHFAIALIERRLRESFGKKASYTTYGVPKDLEGARALAEKNKFEFERWAVTLIPDAQPYKSKGGADSGVDGLLYFKLGQKKSGKAILSVKGGKNIKPSEVRDLKGTVEREKALMGIFITLFEPSKAMLAEAAAAGFVEVNVGVNVGKFPKLQILSIESLLNGERARVPIIDSTVYRRAAREDNSEADQGDLEL